MITGKKGAAKCSPSLRNPPHCHTVCLQVPLFPSNSFSGSFCHSISLSPSLQKVVLCRWFTQLNFSHSSKFKRNQMVSCDCLKHHSYKLPTVGNYQHRLLFLPKKLCFSTCPNPAEGILPSQMREHCSKKALQCQQCLPLTTMRCDSSKEALGGREFVIQVILECLPPFWVIDLEIIFLLWGKKYLSLASLQVWSIMLQISEATR